MPVQINAISIPTTITTRGSWVPRRPAMVHKNGQGAPVEEILWTATWTWSTLDQTDFGWWYTTLLGGAAGGTFTNTNQLYDELDVLTSFAEVRVYRPTYGKRNAGLYFNVAVEMEMLE